MFSFFQDGPAKRWSLPYNIHYPAVELGCMSSWSKCFIDRKRLQCLPINYSCIKTINRYAKSQGGIIGFSQNQSAYHRWCITRHTRAAFVSLFKEQTGLDSIEDAHNENKNHR